jgi:hypothetical protein
VESCGAIHGTRLTFFIGHEDLPLKRIGDPVGVRKLGLACKPEVL